MGLKLNSRKTWAASVVVFTTLITLIVRRRRKRFHTRIPVACATDADVEKTLKNSLLPVTVLPSFLPAGWRVAPPVFYPPHSAAIPLVLPGVVQGTEFKSHPSHSTTKASRQKSGVNVLDVVPTCFIFCSYTGSTEGPFATREDELVHLSQYLEYHPVLRELLRENHDKWTPLSESGPQSDNDAERAEEAPKKKRSSTLRRTFSHVLIKEECVILSGMNGPYVAMAIMTGLTGKWSPSSALGSHTSGEDGCKQDSNRGTSVSTTEGIELSSAIEGVSRATVNVPLVALGDESPALSPRLPGTTFAVHRGYYRVACAREGRELELCVPSEWTVRSLYATFSPSNNTSSATAVQNSLSTKDGSSESDEAIFILSFSPSLSTVAGKVVVRVTATTFSALLDNPKAAAATLWEARDSTEIPQPIAKATLETITARPLTSSSLARTNYLTLVYVQPKFGVLFSVHPRSAVVHEPWMMDLPTILYYPLGDEAHDEEPPLMTIQYVTELPVTWEVLAGDEEEFLHNVVFHFTEEKASAVTTTLMEISGIRCAMFHETREARRCRTYVIPREATILIIRWETLADCWDKHLPVFQQTLDTLHVDAVGLSQ